MQLQDSKFNEIDNVVRKSLTEFTEFISQFSWKGRERESVSLYAFGFLQVNFRQGSIFSSPTQIGIEVTVPSAEELNPKGRVCKDLVLWPEPNMTCWNDSWEVARVPLVIMEWKVFRPIHKKAEVSKYDVDWLTKYSFLYPIVGYAISLDLSKRKFRINVTKVQSGQANEEWLKL